MKHDRRGITAAAVLFRFVNRGRRVKCAAGGGGDGDRIGGERVVCSRPFGIDKCILAAFRCGFSERKGRYSVVLLEPERQMRDAGETAFGCDFRDGLVGVREKFGSG